MATTYTILTNQTPGVADASATFINVGCRWFTETAGFVVGIRFYKAVTIGGTTHTVNLWNDTAAPALASKVSSGEPDVTGWRNVLFDSPVAVAANTPYRVSTHWPTGHNPRTDNMFLAQVDNSPLHVYANGGRFNNGTNAPTFPNATNNSGYFTDVLFQLTLDPVVSDQVYMPMQYVNSNDSIESMPRYIKSK